MMDGILLLVLSLGCQEPPQLSDLKHFPTRKECEEARWINRQHFRRFQIEMYTRLYAKDDYRDVLHEFGTLHDAWDALSDATNSDAVESWRRSNLAWLRTMIGREAYYSGRMPCPVPLRALRELPMPIADFGIQQ